MYVVFTRAMVAPQVCHMALQKMVPRKKGCIVNVSSMLAIVPLQKYYTTYAASKVCWVLQLACSFRATYLLVRQRCFDCGLNAL